MNVGNKLPLLPKAAPKNSTPNTVLTNEKKEYFPAAKKRSLDVYDTTQESSSSNNSQYFLTENHPSKKSRGEDIDGISNKMNKISLNSNSSLSSKIACDDNSFLMELNKWVQADAAPATELANRKSAKNIISDAYLDKRNILRLKRLGLTSLPTAALNKLIHLEILNLKGNKLSEFNLEDYKALTKLTILNLNNNELKQFPEVNLSIFRELEINLTDNPLNPQICPDESDYAFAGINVIS